MNSGSTVWGRVMGIPALCLALGALAACAQTVAPQDCSPGAVAGQSSVRMMVSFRQGVAGDAPDTLQQLQARTGACVVYVSSVSPALHTYGFVGESDPALLRQSLRAWPAVLDAVPDGKARAH